MDTSKIDRTGIRGEIQHQFGHCQVTFNKASIKVVVNCKFTQKELMDAVTKLIENTTDLAFNKAYPVVDDKCKWADGTYSMFYIRFPK